MNQLVAFNSHKSYYSSSGINHSLSYLRVPWPNQLTSSPNSNIITCCWGEVQWEQLFEQNFLSRALAHTLPLHTPHTPPPSTDRHFCSPCEIEGALRVFRLVGVGNETFLGLNSRNPGGMNCSTGPTRCNAQQFIHPEYLQWWFSKNRTITQLNWIEVHSPWRNPIYHISHPHSFIPSFLLQLWRKRLYK
jgi:hypothetical protein